MAQAGNDRYTGAKARRELGCGQRARLACKEKKVSVAIATINRMILWFDEAFRALPAEVPMADVERLAIIVHHSMDAKTRTFHTTRHVFSVGEGMKPVQVLAALFHDIVYYQLDGGLPTRVAALIEGVTRTQDGLLILQPIAPGDRATALCADLFGFRAGQILPLYGGMNEFLSAAVAARLLQDYLSEAQLIALVACIEATVPFRAPDADGRSAAETLAQRVRARSSKGPAQPSRSAEQAEAFVRTVVRDAVTLANQDVAGFSEADPGRCLANTLLLIEESNAPLAAVGVYSLDEYRDALVRMDDFLRKLNPAHVCQSYDGHPDPDMFQAMESAVRRNIDFSRDYLGAILAAVAIIEALALSTGTDCPIAMFLGDIAGPDCRPDRVEDFLPTPPPGQPTSAELLKVLEEGHSLESINDLTASPLTAFVYRFMGQDGTRQIRQQADRMFDGDLSPHAFLKTLDRDMAGAIIRACARIAISRSEALLALEQSL